MTETTNLTAEEVRFFFFYDKETGNLIRKNSTNKNRRPLNTPAGSKYADGYIVVCVPGGRRFQAHRLVWLWVYGVWPKFEIDHINGVRSDNRIENLRDVTSRVNSENRRKPYATNKCGILGATWIEARQRYHVAIRANGKDHFLGLFEEPDEAKNAYIEAKRLLHVGCTI